MNRAFCLLALSAALAAPAPVLAVPGGQIGTLEQGRYICELPGDASGPASRHVPEDDFVVTTASSYRAKGTLGSYLLTGDRVVMTSGTHRGRKFVRVSSGYLRVLNADGSQNDMRCVLGQRAAGEPSPCPLPDGNGQPLLQNSAVNRDHTSCAEPEGKPGRG